MLCDGLHFPSIDLAIPPGQLLAEEGGEFSGGEGDTLEGYRHRHDKSFINLSLETECWNSVSNFYAKSGKMQEFPPVEFIFTDPISAYLPTP